MQSNPCLEYANIETNIEVPQKLLNSIEKDKIANPYHNYEKKLDWIKARAMHYAEKTGLPVNHILEKWEEGRNYWYMNYYQDCNLPLLDSVNARVFEDSKSLFESIGDKGFRCPFCKRISKNPYSCDQKPCDWKVGGIFGHLGKGVYVFVKDKLTGENIFMPVAWEK